MSMIFLMSSKELKHLNSLIESLQTRYKSISVTYGPVIEYLGMKPQLLHPQSSDHYHEEQD